MRKKITKIIAVLTVTAVMAGGISVPGQARTVLTTDALVPSKGCIFVGLEGSYLTDAKAAVKRINAIRKEACQQGVINPVTKKKLVATDYVPIKWSGDLEYIARIRAAEATVRLEHVRPNGESCFELLAPSHIGSIGEVLAWNYSTSMVYGINQWYSEKSDWVNQTGGVTGHYEQLINPRLTYVGLALFSPKQGGWNITSGEFCSEADLYETQAEAAKDVIQTIEVTKSSITATSLSGKKTLEPAEQTPLVFEMTSSGKIVRMLDACQYSSSDTGVASVNEEGVVTGIKEGTATITAKSTSGYSASMTVTVVKQAAASGETKSTEKVSKYMTKTSVKKIKAGKKSLTIYWTKKKSVKGYEVQIAQNKKFTKKKKTKTLSSKKSKVKFSKLKKNKKYYVRIRTYIKVSGKKVYSTWSGVKSKKTK